MILSGEDIHNALREKRVIIDPAPEEQAIDTTSIDLRFGESLWVWNPSLIEQGGDALHINLNEYQHREFSEKHLVEVPKNAAGNYQIDPGKIYLGSTHEQVQFPAGSRLAGRVEGKSRFARLGLVVHMTAPNIHCGTGLGIITLEIFNHGPFTLEVEPGKTRICQLTLEEVSRDPGERTGRDFIQQKSPKG